jgi:hypothetical protein
VCTQGATSPLSGVTAGLTGARTGCGCRVGLSEDEGASCGLTKGNGGLLDTLGCLSMLGLTGDTGRRVSITRGAVAPVIEVVAGLAGMGASLGDARACAGYAVCDGAGCGSLTRLFAVEGHALVGSVGSQGAAFAGVVRTGSIGVSSHCSASCLLASSCFSLPFASSSLPTPDSSLSCCSSIDIASFESVAVAVVVALSSNWVGMGADVVMTWRAFFTGSSCSGVVVVS